MMCAVCIYHIIFVSVGLVGMVIVGKMVVGGVVQEFEQRLVVVMAIGVTGESSMEVIALESEAG